MKKYNRKDGFTLAEILIAMAILAVLLGVGAVELVSQQRKLQQFELDGIAKEIFVAAQNHLTLAESQGFPGLDTSEPMDNDVWGRPDNTGNADIDNEECRYFVVSDGAKPDNPDGGSLRGAMLPQWAVDENILNKGSYIIRYEPGSETEPYRVRDVFYAIKTERQKPARYSHSFQPGEYSALLTEYRDGHREDRLKYDGGKSVIGWYGAGSAQFQLPEKALTPPTVKFINNEQLYVEIRFIDRPASNTKTTLIIHGEDSKKDKGYEIRNEHQVNGDPTLYKFVLDDITENGRHFAQLLEGFYPGEKIEAHAVVSHNDGQALTVVSNTDYDNSLFADRNGDTVYIENIRHLENLSYEISHLYYQSIHKATQRKLLDWNVFLIKIRDLHDIPADGNIQICNLGNPGVKWATENTFMPINWGNDISNYYIIDYDGNGHSIDGIEVDTDGLAGLFGSITGGSVQNLQLTNFQIQSTGVDGHAGALAGYAENVTVAGVLAINTPAVSGDDSTLDPSLEILATKSGADAGGLIGRMNGGTVAACAASLYVRSDEGNAGGLIGSATNSAVSFSYSGGNIVNDGGNAVYRDGSTAGERGRYNVFAKQYAGGLIGSVANTAGYTNVISNCYATCSVYSDSASYAAGGFAGMAEEQQFSQCYGVGPAKCNGAGASGYFIGEAGANVKIVSCYYQEGDFSGITGTASAPIGRGTSTGSLPQSKDTWSNAVTTNARPYTFSVLPTVFDFHTVVQLDRSSVTTQPWYQPNENRTARFVADRHYGDWQKADETGVNGLLIRNEEELTAEIATPVSKASNGLTILVEGQTSGQKRSIQIQFTENEGVYTATCTGLQGKRGSGGGSVPPWLNTEEDRNNWARRVVFQETERGDVDIDGNGNTVDCVKVTILLDSITRIDSSINKKCHFTDLFKDFIPGENLKLYVYSKQMDIGGLTPEKATASAATNSLYEYANPQSGSAFTAGIGNIRHLENLDNSISGVNNSSNLSKVTIAQAEQTRDISFGDFKNVLKGEGSPDDVQIYCYESAPSGTVPPPKAAFKPVTPLPRFQYNGGGYSISQIIANAPSDAGLFSRLDENAVVKNLELIDFQITSKTGNAGALAGAVTGSRGTITGVIVHDKDNQPSPENPNILAVNGNAGGLIGRVETSAEIKNSAAAVYVQAGGSGHAGGLIGSAEGTDLTVTDSYTGGHTHNGGRYEISPENVDWNVRAGNGSAGGLIGYAEASLTVDNCYSTCSAKASGNDNAAGGLIGTSSAGTVSRGYATGKVGAEDGAVRYAFAGGAALSGSGNYYYKLVDPQLTTVDPASTLTVTDMEANVGEYQTFLRDYLLGTTNAVCRPYDADLAGAYTNYPLKAIAPPFGIVYHYGDWPIYETRVINPS